MLDNLAPIWRHFVLMLLGGLLTWGAADLVPELSRLGGGYAVLGAALGTLIAAATPLVRQYGAGSRDVVAELPEGDPDAADWEG